MKQLVSLKYSVLFVFVCCFFSSCSLIQDLPTSSTPIEIVTPTTANCSPTQSTSENNEPQCVRGYYNGGSLTLVVETNKLVYNYEDYIYVTATLINNSKQNIEIHVPSALGYHNELQTEIISSKSKLYDVDTGFYWIENGATVDTGTPTTIVLHPNEKYVQNMRFSPKYVNEYQGYPVIPDNMMPAGEYIGTVTAVVSENNTHIPFSVSFQLTVLPDVN